MMRFYETSIVSSRRNYLKILIKLWIPCKTLWFRVKFWNDSQPFSSVSVRKKTIFLVQK